MEFNESYTKIDVAYFLTSEVHEKLNDLKSDPHFNRAGSIIQSKSVTFSVAVTMRTRGHIIDFLKVSFFSRHLVCARKVGKPFFQ